MKLSKRQHRLWRYSIHKLRKHFSPGVPVRVVTKPLKGYDADCDGVIKLGRLVEIIICINPKQCWKCKRDALVHEWAHAMEWAANWTDDSPKKDHGETWGVWYSKIYKLLTDDLWQDMKERGLIHPDQQHLE